MPPLIAQLWHSGPPKVRKARKTPRTQNAKPVCDEVAFWGAPFAATSQPHPRAAWSTPAPPSTLTPPIARCRQDRR